MPAGRVYECVDCNVPLCVMVKFESQNGQRRFLRNGTADRGKSDILDAAA